MEGKGKIAQNGERVAQRKDNECLEKKRAIVIFRFKLNHKSKIHNK